MMSGPAAQWAPTSLSSPKREVRELPSLAFRALSGWLPWLRGQEGDTRANCLETPSSWHVQSDGAVPAFLEEPPRNTLASSSLGLGCE